MVKVRLGIGNAVSATTSTRRNWNLARYLTKLGMSELRKMALEMYLEARCGVKEISAKLGVSESMVRKYLCGYLGSGIGDMVRGLKAEGMSGYRIAKQLGVTTTTVYWHLKQEPEELVARISETGRVVLPLSEMAREFGDSREKIRRAVKSGRAINGYHYQLITE